MQVDGCCRTSSPRYARHWGREGLDVVEPAQTERRTVHLAWNKPLFGHSSDQFHSCKWSCQQSGSLFWSWTTHGAPGKQALPSLLLSSATFENGSPVVNERVPVDARARLNHKPSRSLQRCPLRVEWISSRPTLICPELGCEADLGCS